MLEPVGKGSPLTALILVGSLFLAACPRSAPPSRKKSATPLGTRVHKEEPGSTIGGSYECRLRTPDDDLTGPCEISAKGDAYEFHMEVGTQRLSGTAQRTSYGLRFEGSFNQMPVSADLIGQGANSYGAILQLEDKSLCKLDISPSS